MMTLKNVINLFNRLVTETTKKSEIKVYQDFLHLLRSLEERNLSEAEILSIEQELDALDLNSTTTDRKRHFSKALRQFKKYLKDTFALITKGYFANLAITFGSLAGLFFGIIFLSSLERSLGISLGISLGAFIGIVIANYLDTQAQAAGKMIWTYELKALGGIDKGQSSYLFLKSFKDWIDQSIERYGKMYRVVYPLLILTFYFGIWMSDVFAGMRELVAERTTDLIFGFHTYTTLVIIVGAALMSLFGKTIHKQDASILNFKCVTSNKLYNRGKML